MKLPHRRQFLHLAAGAAALPAFSRIARAQTYPARPVRIIVGFSPGGAADLYARLLGQWLSERMGRQFVVDNRLGAGGNIATEAAVRSLPDGHTLLLATVANAVGPKLYDKFAFDFVRDTSPVAVISSELHLMVVNPSFSAKTVPEFIEYAKANPGKISMGHSGIGATTHMSGELFKIMAGVELNDVPYRGGPPALADLISGQVQVLFVTMASSVEHARSGRVRALAVTTTTRTDALPNIPCLGEYLPGYETSAWYGVVAPRGVPTGIIERLNKEINAGLSDAKIKSRIAEMSATTPPLSPAQFGKLIADDTEKWAKVIRAANIKPE
jgi:tripartite-type tricarboxylate transporter receptor subunit TctC